MLLVEQRKIGKREMIVVSSRDIAETFEKRHADVLRDIESLNCSEKFTERNFALSSYKDSSGKSNKEYLLTRDGFTIVAMGYTGDKAMRFKEVYIEQFNQMEEMLQSRLVEREKGIVVRQAMTRTIKELLGSDSMHGHVYSNYTNLVYKALFNKNAKQLREVYGIANNEEIRDCFTSEELKQVQNAEMYVSALIGFGLGYDEIKQSLNEKLQRKIA